MQRVDDHQIQPPPPPPPSSSSQKQSQQQQQQQQPKALRFVTNYGAPHPKRRRIGAACLTCRKRKTACSGERPYCDTCKQNKLDCAGYSAESATPTHKRTDSDAGPRRAAETNGSRKGESNKKSAYASDTEQRGSGNELSRAISGGQSPRTTTEGKDDSNDAEQGKDSLFSGPRNRMPYFRWLGPTAIMPGFKQMVVKVKRHDTEPGRSSTDGGMRSPSLNNLQPSDTKQSIYSGTPAAVESDIRTPLSLPFYDTSPMPPSELITHIVNTFFTHLGCNYPFLQRERFLRDLEEKQVDAILVDAVCAIAARFSKHPLLTQMTTEGGSKASPAEYGHAFAQRAKNALSDVFACPTVAAAQAALLLAYNEFGEQRDSGLWMYLGISIRLAQDLGLQKLEGLKYVGRDGPTPKAVKRASQSGDYSSGGTAVANPYSAGATAKVPTTSSKEQTPEDQKAEDDARAVEQERVDTFWAIFFLDRVVSSGVGRRSTLRDKDVELSFPPLSQTDKSSNWPAPFPALIRIVHLYGRVADLLNSIKEPSDITADTPKRLAAMENQVTNFYQNLSPRLHFDAVNFQHYMKAGEGTNFVLLHFWFHTLIILLHQPTLLKTFEGRMLQLFPNSQQLAMSSAKTIADILSYSQLMDAKASLGNPFTSQPIYIAGCAFLRETVEQTATSNHHSRATSPSRSKDGTSDTAPSLNGAATQTYRKASISQITMNAPAAAKTAAGDSKPQLAKHTLLATAASQHYQLCYKALQSLETYWAGAKYILTIMDQKFEGNGDPLLYTTEEAESSMEQPRPEPAFTSPGWRRKLSWGPYAATNSNDSNPSPSWPPKGFGQVPGSPQVDSSKAIGWTLTGTMNSPSTNLAWHYASGAGGSGHNPNLDPRLSSLNPSEYEAATGQVQSAQYPRHLRAGSSSAQRLAAQDKLGRPAMQSYTSGGSATSNGEAESMLTMKSPYNQQGGVQSPGQPISGGHYSGALHPQMAAPTSGGAGMNNPVGQAYSSPAFFGAQPDGLPMNFTSGDMMIESQDVDMSLLGLDMMPWFVDSYPTQDMMGMFDSNAQTGGGASGAGTTDGSGRHGHN